MAKPEVTHTRKRGFGGKCTIDQLETLLNYAMRDACADEAYLDALDSAILRCETEQPSGRLANVEKAWERFKKIYLAEDAERFELSLGIEIPREIEPHSKIQLRKKAEPLERGYRLRRIRRLGRIAAIAAVVVMLVTLLMPQILGYQNIFQMVARWTDEQFEFIPSVYDTPEATEENSDEVAITPLMEDMKKYGLPLSFAPMWFPEEVQLYEAKLEETEYGRVFYTAIFTNENMEKVIYFELIRNSEDVRFQQETTVWEKDGGEVIEFLCNGNAHYIITNNGRTGAHWVSGQYEIAVFGDMGIEEVKAIIKSIYER